MKYIRMRWVAHAAQMGKMRNACKILVIKPEGKSPLGRPRRRWKNYIKMDLKEGWKLVHCIHRVQKTIQWWTLVDTVTKLWIP
jgi:hypothetical protein